MELREVIDSAKEGLLAMMNLKLSSVIEASKAEEGWRVAIELVERKAIPDTQDLLGVYEVRLDENGRMTSYERKRVRRRMDTEEVVE